MRNIDKIKAMNIDEIADFIYRLKDCEDINCDKCLLNSLCEIGIHDKDSIKQWLELEVENDKQ